MPIYVPPSPALPTGSERAEAAASPGEQNTAQADSEARTEKADIPLWEEVPYNRRGGLTELNLDVHVYDEKVSRRFILVNLRKYREGDTLSEGPRVEAITPTGARMRYGELRFRLNRP